MRGRLTGAVRFRHLEAAAGVNDQPGERAEQAQAPRKEERRGPTRVRGDPRSQRSRDHSADLIAHVHESGDAAGRPAANLRRHGPERTLGKIEGAPAPPANTNTATRVSCAREPITRKAAANIMAMAATPDRPARQPFARAMASLSKPPRGEQTAMEMNGSIE